jgi:C4-dicarboxylate transporter DctM subunit
VTIVITLFALMTFFICVSFPIAFAIGIASLIIMHYLGIPVTAAITHAFGGIDSFSLMAIPFFILAGEIMGKARVVEQIVGFANSLVGGLRGGLGHVNVIGSMIFAGISGSGVADASAIGSITIPSMIKQGYGKDFSVAINSCAATIGPIIPPSIPMILWGTLTGTSIGALFLGGVIPGFIVGFGLMGTNSLMCRRRGYDFRQEHFSFTHVCWTFLRSFGALIMPLIIIGGIVFGVFTATEAGVVAVVYGIVFGFLVTRSLNLRHIPTLLINSATASAVVMYIIAMAMIFSDLLTRLHFQEMVLAKILSITQSPTLAILLVIAVLLFLGCFIDPTALIIMFAPTLAGLGRQLGYEPIHFGVLMVIVMLIGAVTPPVGSMLYVSMGIARIQLEDCFAILYPFIVVLVVAAMIVLFVPPTVTWLPTVVFGY